MPFEPADRVPLGYRTTVIGVFTITIDEVDGALTNQDIFIEDKVTNEVHNLKDSPYSFTTVAGTFNDRFVLCYINNVVLVSAPVEVPIVIAPIIVDAVLTQPIVITAPILIEPLATEPIAVISIANEPVLTAVDVVAQLNTDPIAFEINKSGSKFHSNNLENKGKAVLVSAKDNQIKVNSFEENIDSVLVYDLGGKQLYQIATVNSTEFVISNLEATTSFLIIRTQLKNGKNFVNKIVF